MGVVLLCDGSVAFVLGASELWGESLAGDGGMVRGMEWSRCQLASHNQWE